MRTVPFVAAAGLALSALVAPVRAETAQEAKSLLDAAFAEIKTKGEPAAIQEFNAGSKWKMGTMYVVVVDFKGNMLAHSANDKVVGKNMFEAKDASGKPFVQEMVKGTSTTGEAATDLRWVNPQTKKIDEGHILAKRIPGREAYVGALYFK